MESTLTVETLGDWAVRIEATAKKQEESPDNQKRPMIPCLGIMHNFMGAEWVDRHLIYKGDGPDYFRANSDNSDRFMFSLRVMTFGERLQALLTMRVEDGVVDLQGAGLLHAEGFQLRLRPEGYEFDILTIGQPVPCEVKCKLEGTHLSDGTSYDTLNEARGQLPKGRRGLLLTRTPRRSCNRRSHPTVLQRDD